MAYRDKKRPCYKCNRRRVTSDYNCHTDCPDYGADIRADRELDEQINRKRNEDYMMYEVKLKGIKKSERKGNKR
jgi:hypothetical protein